MNSVMQEQKAKQGDEVPANIPYHGNSYSNSGHQGPMTNEEIENMHEDIFWLDLEAKSLESDAQDLEEAAEQEADPLRRATLREEASSKHAGARQAVESIAQARSEFYDRLPKIETQEEIDYADSYGEIQADRAYIQGIMLEFIEELNQLRAGQSPESETAHGSPSAPEKSTEDTAYGRRIMELSRAISKLKDEIARVPEKYIRREVVTDSSTSASPGRRSSNQQSGVDDYEESVQATEMDIDI